ncbi:YlxR family protein [uncultured Nocardioides sp.]|uniref:YlxR family protein n=1 Tax=uncultured Nocardioides sp. TaxID=198441 RepID=UPI00345277DB
MALSRTSPVRTCVGCRGRAAAGELLRVTVGTDAQGHQAVVPDPGRTATGRGAHVHLDRSCYDLAIRRKAFPRALRVPGPLATEGVERLLEPTDTPTDRSWSSSS